MDAKLNKRIHLLQGRFRRFWQQKEYYAARREMGEIAALSFSLPMQDKIRIQQFISDFKPDNLEWITLQTALQDKVNRLHRILDVGSDYEPDEILLLLTERYCLHLILTLLNEAYSLLPRVDLSEIDEKIKRKVPQSSLSRKARQLYHDLYGAR